MIECEEAEVAHATTAFRVSILFIVLAWAVHSVFAPQISRAAGSNRIGDMFRAYGKAIVLTLMALAVPLLIGILFPGSVMSVFGESFRAGASTLRLFLIVNLISLSLGPVLQLLVMTDNSHILPRTGIFKILLTTGLSLVLIPGMGAVGLVIAMGVAALLEELVGLVYIIVKCRRQVPPEEHSPSE